MNINKEITKPAHQKALTLAIEAHNTQTKTAVETHNAGLPRLFQGEGGAQHPNPEAKPIPKPLTEEEYLSAMIDYVLDQLAVQYDTDDEAIDAQIEVLQARKNKIIAA